MVFSVPWRLPEPFMRHPYDGHVCHRRVRAEDVLKFGGGDLKALHLDLREGEKRMN